MFCNFVVSAAMALAAVPALAQTPPLQRVHPADSGVSAEVRGPTFTTYGYEPGIEVGLNVQELATDKFQATGGGMFGVILAEPDFDILKVEKRMIDGVEGGVFNLASREATVAGVRGRISEWSSENDFGEEFRNRLAIARQAIA